MTLIIATALAALLCVLSSCKETVRPPKDTTDTPIVPYSDEFWLAERSLFKPDGKTEETDISEVKKLYSGLKSDKKPNVILESGSHIVALADLGDGTYGIETYLFDGESYIPVFDGKKSFIYGSDISLFPSEYSVSDGTCVLNGKDKAHGHEFTITIEAVGDAGIFKFEYVVTPAERIKLRDVDFCMYMNGKAETTYSQMPSSIYGDNSYGLGMPAAYLWDKGREAVILFDYTDMTWMSSSSVWPAKTAKVMGQIKGSQTMFGLINTYGRGTIAKDKQFNFVFSLYSGFSEKREDGLACIAEKALAVAEMHPSRVEWPEIRKDLRSSYILDWKFLSDGTVSALLNGLAYNKITMNLKDPLLTADKRSSAMYMHYGRQSTEKYPHTDFSCTNNFLSSLAAYNRLNGNADIAPMISAKMDNLQFYYDPEANMIRWGLRFKNQVGAFEMPWQNFFFDVETWRASVLCSPEDYSPAALSSLLSSIEGITELVENSGYVLSQWINPYKKVSETQQDIPSLKTVYEPWQIGSYAYLLVKAYDITGDETYLNMASNALNKVINEVSFEVDNSAFKRTFTDSAEFPITELYGTSYGTYATYRLYELTGEQKYLNWSYGFFGMLSQLTFWYDDNFTDQAKTSTWLGLFEPHGGANHPCPWETIEAYIPLTEILDSTGNYEFNSLMLKLFNCQRVSSFNFYPFTWDSSFSNQMAYNQPDFYCIPTEPMYNSFGGGNSDYGAIYMSSISFWNYLMFSAYGECDNREIMALNTNILSGYEDAMESAKRNFILFNPLSSKTTFSFAQKHLADGIYVVEFNGTKTEYTAEQLKNGLEFTLAPLEIVRVSVSAKDGSLLIASRKQSMARYRLAVAYHTVSDNIQKLAARKFAELLPNASESDIKILSDYVMTYMTYDDAMAFALDEGATPAQLKQAYSNRQIVNGRLKKLVTDEYKLPEAYSGLCEKVNEAYELFAEGKYAEAYILCDTIIAEAEALPAV